MNKEETTLQERISSIINYYGKGKNTRFSELTGVGEASLRGYLKGILPKADFFEKVARYCEGISMDWLITGQGNMLKSDAASPPQYEDINSSALYEMIQQTQDQITENIRQVKKTQEQIDLLLRHIKSNNQ